jgi:hypothetical protein
MVCVEKIKRNNFKNEDDDDDDDDEVYLDEIKPSLNVCLL